MIRPIEISAAAGFALLLATSIAPAAVAQGAATAQAGPASFSHLEGIAQQHRVAAITERRFTHAEFWQAVAPFMAEGSALSFTEIGKSMHGRAIRAVRFGSGPTTVLLWSQMHGDESTATMSLADIFNFLAADGEDPLRSRLAEKLTIHFIPMLNPDGAEVFERQNAAGIDINRDARRLSSPEARTLKGYRDSINPAFGFNLHDQNARTRVGRQGLQAGISLLAPAIDESRGYNEVRSRARLVAATIVAALDDSLHGRIGKYDDSFNPRAFGDLIQQWGTSTVLIESGALPGDPEKQQLRARNVVAILAALDAIATGAYQDADPELYEALPYNAGGAYDLLVVGGQLVLPGQPAMRADVAINYDESVRKQDGRVREVGDLEGAVALDTLDISGKFLHPRSDALHPVTGGPRLDIGALAKFDIRISADARSEVVGTIER
ncbi:MAG TPA: M14 family zinc carboxypeptidase [Gemmatimonadales bacterium]|nr:M14 family zinc carboxypeptidase [Gemmatimonadales bacterium]